MPIENFIVGILKETFNSFLPLELRKPVTTQGDPKVLRDVNLLSAGLIGLVLLIFLATYYISAARFDYTQNSFRMPGYVLLILAWGGISGAMYYAFDVRKSLVFVLPGIVMGGGLFLGIVAFSLELSFPGISLQAGLATICTVLTAQLFNLYRVLDRYLWLESALIMGGSLLMQLILVFALYKGGISVFLNVPEYMDPIPFYSKIVFVTLSINVLMAILALFHLDHLRTLTTPNLSFMEKLHLAANALFVVYFLFLAFLMLFAAARAKK